MSSVAHRWLPPGFRVACILLAIVVSGQRADSFAQDPNYISTPDPGVGVLGNGPTGLPGPPARPQVVTRPAGWPGSPDIDAAAEKTPIAAPHPVSFHGMAPPPDDLSMYRQRLAQRPASQPGVPQQFADQPRSPPPPGFRPGMQPGVNLPPEGQQPGYRGMAPAQATPWQSSAVSGGAQVGTAPNAAQAGYANSVTAERYPQVSAPGSAPESRPVAADSPGQPAQPSQPVSDLQRQRVNSAMSMAIPGAMDIDGSTVVAQVDGHAILASELLPAVNWKIAKNAGKIRPNDVPAARQFLLQQELESAIMLKVLVAAAKRKIPPKNYDELQARIGGEFYRERVPELMTEYEVETRPELDAQLRLIGSSVEREKRAWIERIVAQQWLYSQKKDGEKETTHYELLSYYNENVTEFQYPARAKWEQLTVNFGEQRTKYEARMRIAMAGDKILRGEPFAQVAKAYSDGSTAAEGGVRDWTTRGSLASTVLDEALFSLPVGQLSVILEDRSSLHIIRVTEREDAGQVSFVDAQDKIKATLAKDDKKAERQKYLEDMRKKATVWTIFDRDAPAEQLTAQPQNPPR